MLSPKKGGVSAGVGISVPKPLCMSFVEGMSCREGPFVSWDLSPDDSRGRIAYAWINTGLKGGSVLFTVYLWTAEGLSIRNLELLHALARAVYVLRSPYIIVGD